MYGDAQLIHDVMRKAQIIMGWHCYVVANCDPQNEMSETFPLRYRPPTPPIRRGGTQYLPD